MQCSRHPDREAAYAIVVHDIATPSDIWSTLLPELLLGPLCVDCRLELGRWSSTRAQEVPVQLVNQWIIVHRAYRSDPFVFKSGRASGPGLNDATRYNLRTEAERARVRFSEASNWQSIPVRVVVNGSPTVTLYEEWEDLLIPWDDHARH